jgi:hypothetical protein
MAKDKLLETLENKNIRFENEINAYEDQLQTYKKEIE